MDKNREYTAQSSSKETTQPRDLSPWARYWARQRRVPQDSHLVSFGNKVTYTFAMGNEAASLHYDQARGEVFYKGHRVRGEDLKPWLNQLLSHFKVVLSSSQYADEFLAGYSSVLAKLQAAAPAAPNATGK